MWKTLKRSELLTLRIVDHWGMATISRYPIVGKGKIEFPNTNNTITSNMCIYSDIKINEDTIRVYNVHLQSIQFENEDYTFIENIGEEKEAQIKGSKRILGRLKKAFIKRAPQAEAVAAHIKKSPYPVWVCGDFNDPPSSYAYHTISGNLKDSFMESGWGFGSTYAGKFPSFRIDFILHDSKHSSFDYKIINEKFSDHYPLCCTINLKKLN
jgi:endonuclease/exonuclease/phosphatase family metal-dependent hydrolase